MKTILLVLALGFPVVLFFSWAYEVTPEGLKREAEVDRSASITPVTGQKLDRAIIVVVMLAVAYVAVEKYVLPGRLTPDTPEVAAQNAPLGVENQAASTEPVASDTNRSIAVLPFVNMSDDPGNEYFSDGLSEEILNLLAKIPDLKVIGRTSSFAFKGKNQDLRGIGQALDVKTVLEGSVRKAGDRVRITAQLIDVSDGAHIWSDTYDRTITDIFAVQDDVAAAIIDALQIHVGITLTRGRPTESAEAYALFLKAKASIYRDAWPEVQRHLQQAVELDPNFAEAYEMLAFNFWYQGGWIVDAQEGQALTSEAAAKALAINPDLIFAQALYAASNVETYTYRGSMEAFEQALQEQPGNPAVLEIVIWYLLEAGYIEEALPLAERYVDLEPLLPVSHQNLSDTLYGLGRIDDAIAAMEVTDQLYGDLAKWSLGDMKLVEKQDDVAITYLEDHLEKDGLSSGWVRELVTAARDPATGQAALDRRIPEILGSLPPDYASTMRWGLLRWYVIFGFLDRYYELLLDFDFTESAWAEADVPVQGALFSGA